MTTIKLKRNTVLGTVPTTAQLEVGEVALNTEDGYLYAENSAGTLVTRIGTTADRVKFAGGAGVQDLATSSGASLIGFIQSSIGAVMRLLSSKLAETKSVEDFGAVGDWNGTTGTDDTIAIQKALDSGEKRIYARKKYKTTATLNRPTQVCLFGDGSYASTIVAAHNGIIISTAPAVLEGDAFNSMEKIGVKNAPGFNSSIGIELFNVNQPSFKKVRIESGPIIGMRLRAVLNGTYENMTVVGCTDVGIYIFSTNLDNGCNRNVFKQINNSYCGKGVVVDGYGSMQNAFDDMAVEGSTSFPIQVSNCDQLIFNRLYLEGNAASVKLQGGNAIIFNSPYEVSNKQFIENAPNATNIVVNHPGDPTGAGVASSPNITVNRQGQFQFPSTPIPSANANTLDDYREAAWVPVDVSGAGLVLTVTEATYIKVGRMIMAHFDLTFPVTANANNANIGGLPFASFGKHTVTLGYSSVAIVSKGITVDGQTYTFLYDTAGTPLTNEQLSGAHLRGTAIYSSVN